MKANTNYHPKSSIQMQIEKVEKISQLRNMVSNINEKYNITNAVFGFRGNQACELVEGYMEVVQRFDDLDSCLGSITELNECVQVMNNGTDKPYILGRYHQTLSEIPEHACVLAIDNLQIVKEGHDMDHLVMVLVPKNAKGLGKFEKGSVFFVENPADCSNLCKIADHNFTWKIIYLTNNATLDKYIDTYMEDMPKCLHAAVMTEDSMLNHIHGMDAGAEVIIDKK